MKTIVLLSCVKTKLPEAAKAKDLYVSPLFQYAYRYAKMQKPDAIYILSAKYGLVDPEEIIEPYEMTLKDMSIEQRKEWSINVLEKLSGSTDLTIDKFIFLCGKYYREFLLLKIKNYEIPMQGLPFGSQLSCLKNKLKNEEVYGL